MSIAMQM